MRRRKANYKNRLAPSTSSGKAARKVREGWGSHRVSNASDAVSLGYLPGNLYGRLIHLP
jgi:hypothetical protein